MGPLGCCFCFFGHRSQDFLFHPKWTVCTVDDIVGEYTVCDPQYKTRNLIYHWKQRPDGTQCTPGSVILPQSLFGLPCGTGLAWKKTHKI